MVRQTMRHARLIRNQFSGRMRSNQWSDVVPEAIVALSELSRFTDLMPRSATEIWFAGKVNLRSGLCARRPGGSRDSTRG